jgi:uncharacterized protein YgfB (UPF0149 family)
MSSSAIPPFDYERLRETLADAGAVVAVGELHGGVCGAVCAGGEAAATRWLADCLADQELELTAPMAAELDDLTRTSARMLADREFDFEPLLPDDDAPLDEQVQALALWCQGFLSGIGSTAPSSSLAGGAVEEILRDFAEIGRAGLSEDEAAGQGQPDFALAEIHEYVRASVQIVFEELAPARASAAPGIH